MEKVTFVNRQNNFWKYIKNKKKDIAHTHCTHAVAYTEMVGLLIS